MSQLEHDETIDRALGDTLRSMAWPTPPASFVALTQARFVAARRAREIRHRLYAAVGVAAFTVVTLLAGLTMGLVASKQIVLFIADQLANLALVVNLASTLVGRSALVPVMAALICTVALALSMGIIARMSKATVELR
jgi:hypothetical protein